MKVVIAATDYDRQYKDVWQSLVDLANRHRVPIVDHDGKVLYDPDVVPTRGASTPGVTDPARSRIPEEK